MNSSLLDLLRGSIHSELGLQLRDVQHRAAGRLLAGSLVEMQTGEGKTLTIAVAATLLAELGHRVMVATANDYLASRDAHWMEPIFRSASLSAGVAEPSASDQQRREAYQSSVVYGTIQQFAFDYLRDLMARRENSRYEPMTGKLDAIIVDEADSILIDEARTPLIIHAPDEKIEPALEACFRWAAIAAKDYVQPADFVRVPPHRAVALTDRGRSKLLALPMPPAMNSLTMTDIQHALERAILVKETMAVDHQYLVHEQRIGIVDEYTGRLAKDRTFGGGIHQAIEAREQLPLTPLSHPVARITVQQFAGLFSHLCGVTATASEDRHELRRVYGFRVEAVPPFRPCRRIMLEPMVCQDQSDKRERIIHEVREVLAAGRAVLIGTRTIKHSEALSRELTAAGIDHQVLNARHHRQEAAIVAAAGTLGRVTVATNMAGRGTHIPLDENVRRAGGLHVIVAEMNTAARIDAQLVGRCARQGEPGSARIYVAPSDQIFELAYGDPPRSAALHSPTLIRRAARAQKRIQRLHQRQRNQLTAHESHLAASLRSLGLDPYLDQPAAW